MKARYRVVPYERGWWSLQKRFLLVFWQHIQAFYEKNDALTEGRRRASKPEYINDTLA